MAFTFVEYEYAFKSSSGPLIASISPSAGDYMIWQDSTSFAFDFPPYWSVSDGTETEINFDDDEGAGLAAPVFGQVIIFTPDTLELQAGQRLPTYSDFDLDGIPHTITLDAEPGPFDLAVQFWFGSAFPPFGGDLTVSGVDVLEGPEFEGATTWHITEIGGGTSYILGPDLAETIANSALLGLENPTNTGYSIEITFANVGGGSGPGRRYGWGQIAGVAPF